MSHQNGTDANGNLIKNNDHRIIDRLLELTGNQYTRQQLFTLKGLYTAAQSKAIISKFDVLLSGRIHGAVQGLSQSIPTVIIDYGHEPKAHKLKGFAKTYGVEKYIVDPANVEEMKVIINDVFEHQEEIRKTLNDRIPEVKKLALNNFKLLKRI